MAIGLLWSGQRFKEKGPEMEGTLIPQRLATLQSIKLTLRNLDVGWLRRETSSGTTRTSSVERGDSSD